MSTIQTTFEKHLRLLIEHLNLTENSNFDGWIKKAGEEVKSSGINTETFKNALAAFDSMAENLEIMDNHEGKTINDLDDEVTDDNSDYVKGFFAYVNSDANVDDFNNKALSLFVKILKAWPKVRDDYAQKSRKAKGDMDAMSMLDMHPGLSYTNYINNIL
jgi:hypothetical protein